MERRLSAFFTAAIAQKAGYIESQPNFSNILDPAVTGLVYDSRKVKPGNLYFALHGLHTDGHRFIPDAVTQGAAVIVHQDELAVYQQGVVYIRVQNSRFAMSPLSAAFYGFPSQHLKLIGVTGTEGKSTTVYLVYQLLRLWGERAGFLSTVQFSDGGDEQWNPEHQTTPEAPAVQEFLARVKAHGAEYAVLEASSHGLSPLTNRLGDVAFDVGIMTNVTHEHLEFHGTWEQYRTDKANLFRALDYADHHKLIQNDVEVPCFGVVNADDPSAAYFAAAAAHKTYTFSTQGRDADLSLQKIESNAHGNSYQVRVRKTGGLVDIQDQLPGAFNAGNVLASLLTLSELLKVPVQELIPLVNRLKPVRGRMTAIQRGQPFEVVVDFAHTPSSFKAVFPPLRKQIDKRGGRIISVFGSAGERDTKKRSEQGNIASKWSDVVILTDEDPRGEVPMDILEAIAQGISNKERGADLFLIPNRPAAVRQAFDLAKPGDLVLLLGKGHENSIIYAAGAIAYDECTEAENALAELGF